MSEEKISSKTIFRGPSEVRLVTLERNASRPKPFWSDHEMLLTAIKRIRRVKVTPYTHILFMKQWNEGHVPVW